MPSKIALALTILFIFYLLKTDARRKPHVSHALWIPWIWFTIFASRSVSAWFGTGVSDVSADHYLEGSPFDRNIFIAIIAIGVSIVWRRRPDWPRIITHNRYLLIYIFYLGLSTLWSDYSFVSFKRWIKELGHITMVLIVLTEEDPIQALRTMIARSAFVLIPLSLVLNNYFPELSRIYSIGGGNPMLAGVTTNKNSLGALCMVCGPVLLSNLLSMYKNKNSKPETRIMLAYVLTMTLTIWLLFSAHSATSLLGTAVFSFIVLIFGSHTIRNKIASLKYYAFFLAAILGILHLVFDLTSLVSSSVGRDETLTGRTPFWQELIAMETNPLIGTGYESFWLGERISYFWDKYWWHPNQAHNGYLEIYLNLGIVGLTLLLCGILSTFRTTIRNLVALRDYDYQVLRIAFLVIFLAINITEANFKGFSWLVFLFFAFEGSGASQASKIYPNGMS